MKLALSTSWFRDPDMPGEEIAERAGSLGFDAIELGLSTTAFQAGGFKRRLAEMPVCSVHAFCPVPVSAPQGYPELYALASPDADQRAIARFHVAENLRFAASLGAGAVVLHAGRVPLASFWRRDAGTAALSAILDSCSRDVSSPAYSKALAKALALRRSRGAKLMDCFKKEVELLVPVMRETGVSLALENLPRLVVHHTLDPELPCTRTWLSVAVRLPAHAFLRRLLRPPAHLRLWRGKLDVVLSRRLPLRKFDDQH